MYSILPTEPRRTVEEDAFRLTLPEIVAFVRRYALIIAAVFALTVVTAYGALNLMSEQYEAQSSLLVKLAPHLVKPLKILVPAFGGPRIYGMDELVRQLFDPLCARLKAELRLDRERAGLLTDLHR